jgi:hypothetical protein
MISKVLFFLFLSMTSKAEKLNQRIYIDSLETLTMTAGQFVNWDFEYEDDITRQYPHHFHEMHEKPMHLIIISQDFASFSHVHPTLNPHARRSFSIELNMPTDDPDNFQAQQALQLSGKYFVFSEVMPMNYGMLMFPATVTAEGAPRNFDKLIPDSVNPDGSYAKFFDQNGQAVNPDQAYYKLQLKTEPLDLCNTIVPKFYLEFWAKDKDNWRPIQDLQTWLGAFAHAFIIGSSGENAEDKVIQHLHSVWPIADDSNDSEEKGPFVEMAAHSHGLSTKDDIYAVWIQFKHNHKKQTLRFTIDWKLPPKGLIKKSCGVML